MGTGIQSLVDETDEERFRALVHAGRAGTPSQAYVRLRGRPGRCIVYAQPSAGAVAVAWKPAPEAVAIPHEAHEEMRRLRELNEARTQFINTAAHEFATPLTPLRVQIELLSMGAHGPLSAPQTESVEILRRNLDRLGHLVHDVMDAARIEGGRLRLTHRPLDLADVARHAVDSLRAVAEKAGIELRLASPQRLAIEGDEERLTQVFVNLLHNAIKFTPTGGRVETRIGQEAGLVRVDVRDNGIGIRPEALGKLFQPFSQVHDTMERTEAGSGLGLSICQGIVVGHGGRIWCESDGPGQGTTFSFTLPPKGALAPAPVEVGIALAPREVVRKRGGWTLFHFKCPTCGSRDIEIRLLRNRYDCNACRFSWR